MSEVVEIDGCSHTNVLQEPHVCPLKSDIHGNDELCRCCEACEHDCAMEI